MIETSLTAVLADAEATYAQASAVAARAKKRVEVTAKAAKAALHARDLAEDAVRRRQRENAAEGERAAKAAAAARDLAVANKKRAIFAHWQERRGKMDDLRWRLGSENWRFVAEEFHCSEQFAVEAVAEVFAEKSQAVPEFHVWAKEQRWSREAIEAYRWPTRNAAYTILAMSEEAFRDALLTKMATVPRSARPTVRISLWRD
jgi:hypothetical protein